jgi:uncharacterized protein YciI
MVSRTIAVLMISYFIVSCSSSTADRPTDGGLSQPPDSSYYFVFLNTNPERPVLTPDSAAVLQSLHMATIGELYTEGKLDLAGPFNGGGGIFVLKAPDSTTARSYLNGDAAVMAGRFIIELLPFQVSAGGLCKIPADNEMVQYGFLRFKEKMEGMAADNPDQRAVLYESGELLFSGWFNESDAGIMIVRSNADSLLQAIAAAHPGVSNGHLSAEIRQLWVGRGIFCE